MQAVLNRLWQHLLPAMAPAPLTDDPEAGVELERRCAGLALPVLSGSPSPLAAQLSGRTFAFDANGQQARSVRFDFNGDRTTVTFVDHQATQNYVCGDGEWIEGTAADQLGERRPVAATGAWTGENTFELLLRYTRAPFGFSMTSRFDGDNVSVEQKQNVSFGPIEVERLEGRLEH